MKSIFKVFASFRMFVVLILGFSSGLPLGLTSGTLQAWMKTENIDLGTIGLFSLVGIPYTLKFIWSPLMDRYIPPLLGRRRGWILLSQIGLVITIIALGFSDPKLTPKYIAFFAVCVAFFSASQDIAVDAYRAEILEEEELGAGASLYIMGYRLAMIVSGALALILADHLSWSTVYLIMALCMTVGIIGSIFGPEPKNNLPPKSLGEAIYKPFVEFFKRAGAIEMLIFILIYKVDVAFAMALTTPFMMDLGFTKTDVGAVLKGVGMIATIGGTLLGGALLSKWKIKKSLWVFGILQALSGFSFFLLAKVGHSYPMMMAAICVENVCSGLATAAFTAFMMNLCDKRFTATQYALLTSFMAITRIMVQTPSGYIAKALGWEMYFIISIVISIPGLLLLTRYDKWQSYQIKS
ncbi:MAG: AmpG family muropeptide MFS transporter [Bacteriovorax sp.]|nr:AmpG family muropeptide MFS transporter [Bacteriovorax sp.]